MPLDKRELYFRDWKNREEIAETMIPVIGRLYRNHGVVDSLATIVEGNRIVLYVWYDNEFGYSCQVVRMLDKIAGLELPSLPN